MAAALLQRLPLAWWGGNKDAAMSLTVAPGGTTSAPASIPIWQGETCPLHSFAHNVRLDQYSPVVFLNAVACDYFLGVMDNDCHNDSTPIKKSSVMIACYAFSPQRKCT